MTLDLKALRELRAKTTTGTWEVKDESADYAQFAIVTPFLDGPHVGCDLSLAYDLKAEDAAFIVAAHAHWNALLDELRDWRIGKLVQNALLTQALSENESLRTQDAQSDAVIATLRGENESLRAEVGEESKRADEYMENAIAQRLRAEQTEVERDALRAEVARLKEKAGDTPAATVVRCILCGTRADAFGCYETCTAEGPFHEWSDAKKAGET